MIFRSNYRKLAIYIITFFILFSALAIPIKAEAASSVKVKKLASGTKYETKLYVIKSGKAGPVVLIVGGVHGNEIAGYKAALKVCNLRPSRGTLLVIPKANVLAIAEEKRVASGQLDLNRAFPSTKTGPARGILANSILKVIKDYDVDWVMDMHEGYDYARNPSTVSVGQSLIYYPSSSVKTIGSRIVKTLNKNISLQRKEFSLLKPPVKGSISRAAAVTVGARSFIFETCSRESLATRINHQLKAANMLLDYLNMK
ncbi:MAG TPA: succinylglutamate desuccinylase/aspartoacylase family protein [Syntrophomonas sp.]|nr:succinylglutamate desuccinylase/aspartoacylase family protein [Syntrophomonas sp.]HRW12038.1 succinylglutamate desuccinylase/aspartoacylase family protein [Syntrophomonas sp.]